MLQTIAIISGKGGVGKTSLALSICRALGLLEHKVLLVDADLGTHGASYFLKVPENCIALDELAFREKIPVKTIIEITQAEAVIPAEDKDGTQYGFDFLPSTAKFREEFAKPGPINFRDLLQAIRFHAVSNQYEYMFYDCQSGANEFTRQILDFSDSAVIVAEADAVSAKAIKTLEKQIKSLPSRTKYLINKLHLKETTSYRVLTSVLRTFDYLPPIPFDFDVREFFAVGDIPLDFSRPSSYAYAILRVMKELIPESRAEFEAARSKLREAEIGNYRTRLKELQTEKKGIDSEITQLKVESTLRRQRLVQRIVALLSIVLILIGGGILFNDFIPMAFQPNPSTLLGMIIVLIGLSIPFLYSYWRSEREIGSSQETIEALERKLSEVKTEIDKYKTLLVTETEAYPATE